MTLLERAPESKDAVRPLLRPSNSGQAFCQGWDIILARPLTPLTLGDFSRQRDRVPEAGTTRAHQRIMIESSRYPPDLGSDLLFPPAVFDSRTPHPNPGCSGGDPVERSGKANAS